MTQDPISINILATDNAMYYGILRIILNLTTYHHKNKLFQDKSEN